MATKRLAEIVAELSAMPNCFPMAEAAKHWERRDELTKEYMQVWNTQLSLFTGDEPVVIEMDEFVRPMFTAEELAEMDALDKAMKEDALASKQSEADYERAYRQGAMDALLSQGMTEEQAQPIVDECVDYAKDAMVDESRYY